jgi:hypothetical protein
LNRKTKTKNKREEKKEKGKIKKEKGRVLWTFHPFVHLTQSGEAVLPNVFLKQFQIYPRICSTGTTTAGAATGAATTLSNAP